MAEDDDADSLMRAVAAAPARSPQQKLRAPRVPGFAVAERLGSGGFGEVYRARREVIDRECAIKFLHAQYSADAEAVARFIAEARAVNKVSHPGIVEIFDFGVLDDGRHYCVMELIRGTTLRDLLRERGHLPIDEALPILRGIAEAVDAAHAAGITHRDLKPDNVFVIDGSRIKLIDFGLAKLTREDAVPVTQTGSVFGTPLYMSPEQCRGNRVTVATDAYSFGVLAYQVLTGELPFSGDALELALHHLNDTPEPPSRRRAELSSRVDRVVLALLAKDPAERPSNLVMAVDAIAGNESLPPRPRRRMPKWLLATIAIAAIGAGGLISMRPAAEAVATDSCDTANEQLSGVWDPTVRTTLYMRFLAAGRVDGPGAWQSLTRYLDPYASRWRTQWTAACRADDRQSEPLLYAQRMACLDNALIALRGVTPTLLDTDIGRFSEGFVGQFGLPLLEDCANPAVLRAQVPPPPPAQRAAITELMVTFQRVRAAARAQLNSDREEKLLERLDQLEGVRKQLAALGSPLAAEAATWRAWYLNVLMVRGGSRPDARGLAEEALTQAIAQATKDRHETMLSMAYLQRVMVLTAATGSSREIEQALVRTEEAWERGGRPLAMAAAVTQARAQFEERRGNVERAVELLRQVRADYARHGITGLGLLNNNGERLWLCLVRLGRFEEAIAEARRYSENLAADFGRNHRIYVDNLGSIARALVWSGDLSAAVAQLEVQLAGYRRVGAAQSRISGAMRLQLDLLLRLGRIGDANRVHDALIAAGETDLSLAKGSFEVIAVVANAINRLEHARPIELYPAAVDDAQARMAFIHGDLETAIRRANRVPRTLVEPSPDADDRWITGVSVGSGFAAIALAATGHPTQALARLADYDRLRESPEPFIASLAHFFDGATFAQLGRWQDARASLAKAYFGNDPVEVDAWLGRAEVEIREWPSAIERLERALSGSAECCWDQHYVTPMAKLALARALWDSGGDKRRARRLAEQARDAFAARGRFGETERAAAARWLADHAE